MVATRTFLSYICCSLVTLSLTASASRTHLPRKFGKSLENYGNIFEGNGLGCFWPHQLIELLGTSQTILHKFSSFPALH